MNKRRKLSRGMGLFGTILIIVCALVATAAGISHAMLKNRQLQVVREIEKVQNRISELDLDIATEQLKVSALLDRYEVRSSLEKLESEMVVIPLNKIEEIPLQDHPTRIAVNELP